VNSDLLSINLAEVYTSSYSGAEEDSLASPQSFAVKMTACDEYAHRTPEDQNCICP